MEKIKLYIRRISLVCALCFSCVCFLSYEELATLYLNRYGDGFTSCWWYWALNFACVIYWVWQGLKFEYGYEEN